MKCIFCNKDSIEIVRSFKTEEINILYRKQLNIDVSYLFNFHSIDLVNCNDCHINYFVPLVSGDNKFYQNLAKFDWYYQKEKIEYDVIKNYIKKNSKVLDIGCGQGHFSKYLQEVNYTGLEPNAKCETILNDKAKILNITLKEHLENINDAYDYVCLFQVLEHITNPYELLNDVKKILKTGGKLIISVPNNDSYLKYMINGILNFPPHHLIRWTKNSLNKIGEVLELKNIFTIELPLDDIHHTNYSYAIGKKITSLLFFQKHKELNLSISNKINNILSRPFYWSLNKLVKKKILQPLGHSIIGIYEKT